MNPGIFILALLIYSNLFAQFNRIDKGNGQYDDLKVATTVIKLLEQGNLTSLDKYFAPSLKIDWRNLKLNCDYISKEFSLGGFKG